MEDSYLACNPEGKECSSRLGWFTSNYSVKDHPSKYYNQLTNKVKKHAQNTAKYYAEIISKFSKEDEKQLED